MTHLEEAFNKFHSDNPHVLVKLVEIARFIKANTKKERYGMKALFERLRWISEFETVSDDYKLNNNYTAFYARMLNNMAEFEGFFQLRRSVADREGM